MLQTHLLGWVGGGQVYRNSETYLIFILHRVQTSLCESRASASVGENSLAGLREGTTRLDRKVMLVIFILQVRWFECEEYQPLLAIVAREPRQGLPRSRIWSVEIRFG